MKNEFKPVPLTKMEDDPQPYTRLWDAMESIRVLHGNCADFASICAQLIAKEIVDHGGDLMEWCGYIQELRNRVITGRAEREQAEADLTALIFGGGARKPPTSH
jgi:hypothetical protein